MENEGLRWNVVFASIYGFLLVYSLYIIYELPEDGFAALFACILTFPWSLIVAILNVLAPSYFKDVIPLIVALFACGLLNVVIMLYGFTWYKRLFNVNKNG